VQEYDYVNSEALKRLAFATSDTEVIRELVDQNRVQPADQTLNAWALYFSDMGRKRHHISAGLFLAGLDDHAIVRAMFIDGDGRLGVILCLPMGITIEIYDTFNGAQLPEFQLHTTEDPFCFADSPQSSPALSFNSDIVRAAMLYDGRLSVLSKTPGPSGTTTKVTTSEA
jgi:hypothetical protein